MLVLSRRADESIVIQPADGVDVSMTLAQLFANGPILITLLGGTGRRVKMGIEAPEQLAIRRKDTLRDSPDCPPVSLSACRPASADRLLAESTEFYITNELAIGASRTPIRCA